MIIATTEILNGDSTDISVDFDFTPKGGVAGKAVGPGLKVALSKSFAGMLEDWEAAA